MLERLVRDLIPAAQCHVTLLNAVKNISQSSGLSSGAIRSDVSAVYTNLIAPCLKNKTSLLASQVGANLTFRTVSVGFHDHPSLVIPDYFTGLGYILSLQNHGPQKLLQRIRLLAMYAKLCKLSAPLVQSRPPTTVQLLWVNSPADTRIVLGSSLAWLKARSHFQMARAVREGTLRALWHAALVDPTPMQVLFPNPVGSLFGTCWGDCAEAISLAALWRLVTSGAPLGTLAVNVAAMNAVDPLTGLSACDALLADAGAVSLRDAVQILARANAFRAMCKNCEHLCGAIGADIVDCARPEFWLHLLDGLGSPQALARA